MKVTRNKPPRQFVPIVIELENQDEVDALYAIATNTIIVPRDSPLYCLFDTLRPHTAVGVDNVQTNNLDKRLAQYYGKK